MPVVQGLQKGNQFFFFCCCKAYAGTTVLLECIVECWAHMNATVVMFQNGIQIQESAIMHVWRSVREIPEAGDFEGIAVFGAEGYHFPADVILQAGSESVVPVGVVKEQRCRMTTVAFGLKDPVSLFFGLRECFLLTHHAVVFRIAADTHDHELGERFQYPDIGYFL